MMESNNILTNHSNVMLFEIWKYANLIQSIQKI